MNSEPTLVLGSTGKTGRRVTACLRLQGRPVRAASRTSPTRFDWSDPDGWAAALDGVGAVYIVPPPTPGPVHDFVAQAESAGVRRLVLLSGRGAGTWGDSTFGLNMLSAEEAVRSSSVAWSIARASNFNQNFDEDLYRAPILSGRVALPAGSVPEPFVDVEDVADVAAVLLTEPGHGGSTYELSGPRAMTWAEAVEQIARGPTCPRPTNKSQPQTTCAHS